MEFTENTSELIAQEAKRLHWEIIKSVRLIGQATGLSVTDINVNIEKILLADGGISILVRDVNIVTTTGGEL